MEQDVFVLFGLKERNTMDLELAKCASIKFMQQTMQMSAKFFIQARDKLRDFLLRYGGCEIDIPGG